MASEAPATSPDPDLLRRIERVAAIARAEGLDAVDELLADVLALLHGWPAAKPVALRPRRPAPALRVVLGGRV